VAPTYRSFHGRLLPPTIHSHARTLARTHEEGVLNLVYLMVYDSADCKTLGVMDNMCGKCTALKGGGFQLEETTAGLRSVC